MSYSQSEFNTKPECVPQCTARDAALYSDALLHVRNGCNQAQTQNVIITPPGGGVGGPQLPPPTFPGEPGLPGKPGLPGLNLGLRAATVSADTTFTEATLPSLIFTSGGVGLTLPADVLPGTRVVVVHNAGAGNAAATINVAGGASGSMQGAADISSTSTKKATITPGAANQSTAGEFIFIKAGSRSFWLSLYNAVSA